MAKTCSTLYLSAKIGDRIQIGDSIIEISEKSGRRVRLGVMSSHKVTVFTNPSAQECLTETQRGDNHGKYNYHDKRTAN